jgi:hypothetical protein
MPAPPQDRGNSNIERPDGLQISRSKAAVQPSISPQHVVPLHGVVDRGPLNLACLVACQGRLRMSPEGQTPESQNKYQTGNNDFDHNPHVRLHSCSASLGSEASVAWTWREAV